MAEQQVQQRQKEQEKIKKCLYSKLHRSHLGQKYNIQTKGWSQDDTKLKIHLVPKSIYPYDSFLFLKKKKLDKSFDSEFKQIKEYLDKTETNQGLLLQRDQFPLVKRKKDISFDDDKNIYEIKPDWVTSIAFYGFWGLVLILFLYNIVEIQNLISKDENLSAKKFREKWKLSKGFIEFLLNLLGICCFLISIPLLISFVFPFLSNLVWRREFFLIFILLIWIVFFIGTLAFALPFLNQGGKIFMVILCILFFIGMIYLSWPFLSTF